MTKLFHVAQCRNLSVMFTGSTFFFFFQNNFSLHQLGYDIAHAFFLWLFILVIRHSLQEKTSNPGKSKLSATHPGLVSA